MSTNKRTAVLSRKSVTFLGDATQQPRGRLMTKPTLIFVMIHTNKKLETLRKMAKKLPCKIQ